MNPVLRLSSLAVLLSVSSTSFVACSGDGAVPAKNQGRDDDAATVTVNLDVAPGITLSSVSYTVTGPGSFTTSGTLDVSHSTTLSGLIGNLPAGSGFSIALSATAADGTSCSGSAPFSVTAHATNTVSVHLTCHEPARTGSVLLSGTTNLCPQIDGVGANPAEAIVGNGIRLSSSAHDTDHGPSPITYAWTSTSGVFDNTSSQNPLFTCSVPGPVTITLTVSDGDPLPNCADNLSVSVNCTNPPPQPYAWVELGSGGAILARVATPDTTCPNIIVDGVSHAMSVRIAAGTVPVRTSSASPVLPSAFPVTACEYTIPSGTNVASVLGANLPLPKANPTKIVVIGDTGCRLKTGNPWQACSDTTQWPFPVVADAAAAQHPDLVLHVGDYHYRENACPSNITGCQGSPWSYGWDAWEADLFRPAESLMHAAPWIMVRGNHEECLRGGQGWFRFLDTRPYAENHSCNDPANDTIANYDDPYAVPVGTDTNVIVFDTAKAGAAALNPSNSTDAPIFNTYQSELLLAAGLASDASKFNIWANHHPLLGYTPGTPSPTGGQGSILSVMNATYPGAYYPPNIKLALHGHVHLFEGIDFSTPHPPTFVAGIGGDNLDAVLPDPFPMSLSPAAGVTPDQVTHDNVFGFMVMEKVSGSWTYKVYKVDGTLLTTCNISSGDKLSCTPTGYLH